MTRPGSLLMETRASAEANAGMTVVFFYHEDHTWEKIVGSLCFGPSDEDDDELPNTALTTWAMQDLLACADMVYWSCFSIIPEGALFPSRCAATDESPPDRFIPIYQAYLLLMDELIRQNGFGRYERLRYEHPGLP